MRKNPDRLIKHLLRNSKIKTIKASINDIIENTQKIALVQQAYVKLNIIMILFTFSDHIKQDFFFAFDGIFYSPALSSRLSAARDLSKASV